MINIAIDGPAGAGKSTVAKAVAKDLGIIYLDTGAMYRATAYCALKQNISVTDEESVKAMLETMSMDIVYEDGAQQIYVNGINATPYLREHYMSKAASDISALPPVRYKMVELQREFAKSHDVVLDGRDIGTFVLPDANCKFYMTATAEERATRRYKELVEKGQSVDYGTLLNDIIQRDYNDSHREVAPLKQADDAEFVDTTDMGIDDVVSYIKEIVHIKTKAPDMSVQTTDENSEADNETTDSEDESNKKKLTKRTSKRMKKYYKRQTNFGFYRFIRVLLHPIQCILWPTKVVNKANGMIEGSAIYTCNHYTKIDSFIPCFALFKKEAHILAKQELFKVPISGWFLHKMGAIPVRRGEADIDAVKNVLGVLRGGKKLLIFPEGTRNKEGTQDMAEFKTGTARFAIRTKSPIVPMLYYSAPKLFRRNWLYVGEPFTLDEYYDRARTAEYMHAATETVREKMDETRRLCNEYVEGLKSKKKKDNK